MSGERPESAGGPAATRSAADPARERIALVGFGEVGRTLAEDLLAAGVADLVAWDRLFAEPASGPGRSIAALGRVRQASGTADALRDRTLVISAVTAGECVAAARDGAPALARGAVWFDLNSVAPATKAAAARLVEVAGGRYVEAAVMSPIAPRRIASPMLIGGPHARAFEPVARALGFRGVETFAEAIGHASAAKMCRSVMIKGMEALLTESLLTARRYGVERTVLASLADLFPAGDWRALARYMISRSLLHGTRRAEEMREAARTVADAGLEPWMSAACAQRQAWAPRHADALGRDDLDGLLDAILDGVADGARRGTAPETA